VASASAAAQAPAAGRANPPAQSAERQPGQNAVKDSWITLKVHTAFVPDDLLEGSNIDVTTRAGVVTLAGTVPSEASRARAIALTKSTDGVKSVTDSLRIAAPASAGAAAGRAAGASAKRVGRSVNDGWIKSKIYAQFLTDWNVFEDSDIDIDVENGAVALNGSVKTTAAKSRAAAIAKATDGVKSVKDNLHVGAAH
jgi:hyperosmotically inducible protein